ncbi:MAG: HD domain-containing protein [Promethearchaeota archaeon]
MVEQIDFEKNIKNLTSKNTLNRVKSIPDKHVRILRIDKKNGIIEAEIQGNKLIPYKLNINISLINTSNFIEHDCPDYLARKKHTNKFCKHIVKFFYVLKNQDHDFATNLLKQISSKIKLKSQQNTIDLLDINQFVNGDLKNQLEFDYKGFDFFFDLVDLEDSKRDLLEEILIEAKKLPAALRGIHGGYTGGLFDHILLVTNYSYNLCKSKEYDVNIKKAVLTAIYHDFGKISYYSFKRKNFISKFEVNREELEIIHEEVKRKFNFEGRDYHVEETVAVIKRKGQILYFDDEMYQAIIFHHGKWSKYLPIEMNNLGTLIHKADMIASQTHYI